MTLHDRNKIIKAIEFKTKKEATPKEKRNLKAWLDQSDFKKELIELALDGVKFRELLVDKKEIA